MQRKVVLPVAVMAATLALTTSALGSLPMKSGVYVGDVKSVPFPMHVSVGVTAAGTTARFTYLCGTGRPPTTVFGVPIDAAGKFAFTKMTGTALVWKVAGHFTSPTTAFVSLNSIACGGSKGSTKLKLK